MFDREKKTYEANLPRWQVDYQGQWVVIHDDQVLGLFASHREGYVAATTVLDEQPFLLRQVTRRSFKPSGGLSMSHR